MIWLSQVYTLLLILRLHRSDCNYSALFEYMKRTSYNPAVLSASFVHAISFQGDCVFLHLRHSCYSYTDSIPIMVHNAAVINSSRSLPVSIVSLPMKISRDLSRHWIIDLLEIAWSGTPLGQ